VLKAARRSADITRQLLGFASRQTATPSTLNLNGSVEDMLGMLRRLIGENIELSWEPDLALWPVRIDPTQFEQILVNLCLNARDSINGTGKIAIGTRCVEVKGAGNSIDLDHAPGAYVELTVSDDGCGMDGETLARAFDPFFTTKETGRGTGLGLATAHGIARQNGGFIDVHSQPGRGSTFVVGLPRHLGKADLPTVPFPTAPVRGDGETLLLVEDEPGVRAVCKMMLERLGYRVLVAETPESALSLVREHDDPIRLLITDVVMPGMNGRELALRLNALDPCMKTLFMSGYTAEIIDKDGKLDNGFSFLQKPFTAKDLSTAVRSLL
jgi:two-component system, cell cycle sensor histidine kinase and response regulator CckA